jgi:ABC-2 type transport system ATP-binding protein
VASLVRLEDLHLSFGKVRALDGLSLEVQAGEIYGFLGRNGAGKTTTLRVLMGLLAAKKGTVELLGERVKRVPVRLKQRIGYVSQDQTFYPWMSGRDLGRFVRGFYPTWSDARFTELLKRLDVPEGRRSAELSGGTRTKLALALALASQPPLLLLDEPTAGLDPVARREFNDLVAATTREQGTTVFFSSHLVDEVEQIAHRVGIVQQGKLRFEGGVAALLASLRHLSGPVPLAAPPELTLLRDGVYRAAPEVWAALPLPDGVAARAVAREEAFLAFARTDAPA